MFSCRTRGFCPSCYAKRVEDRIIDHLKLRFVAAKPPPPHVFEQVALTAAEESGESGVVLCDIIPFVRTP